MNPTKNDLSEKTRQAVGELLNAVLADLIDLHLQSKQAHWNVKGPQFIALHELFDSVAGKAEEFSDTVAERLVALGGTAEGIVQIVAERSKLKAYPLKISAGCEHVDALSSALAAAGKAARAAIDRAAELNDADTADVFTEVSREIDKTLWFVEAHLQGEK